MLDDAERAGWLGDFRFPSRVAKLCRRAGYDVPGARTGSTVGDDVHAWIGTRRLTRSSSLADFYEAYFNSGSGPASSKSEQTTA